MLFYGQCSPINVESFPHRLATWTQPLQPFPRSANQVRGDQCPGEERQRGPAKAQGGDLFLSRIDSMKSSPLALVRPDLYSVAPFELVANGFRGDVCGGWVVGWVGGHLNFVIHS